MPFTPAGEKKNLVSLLAARSDWPNYGQLLSFRLPTDRQIDGPSQVEARIENDKTVSQQFTLWAGPGSQIIRGQLLVIPIAGTIIYVEPLYLRSDALNFPELKQVILADDSNLVMADTIQQGIARLVGSGTAAPTPSSPEAAGNATLDRVHEMERELEDVQDSLQQLQQSLEGLREALAEPEKEP